MINSAVVGTKMKSKIEVDDNDNLILTIPDQLISLGLFLPDDDIAMQVKRETLYITNLSCPILRFSRFRRNLNSILRNMNNEDHPLKRVLITRRQKSFWCIPHDGKQWPEFVDRVTFSDEPKKG